MYKRLSVLLLLAVASQRVQCQSDKPAETEVNDVEQESELVEPEDKYQESDNHPNGVDEETNDVPLVEDMDIMTNISSVDEINCPADLCVCTHENYGETIELVVDCSLKNLTELPAGIDTRVNRLFLQNNQLEEVTKDISKFQKLEELNVNDNAVKEFAFGSVSELPNLRVLQIANNRLTQFPQELKLNLVKLEVLDLGNNDIKDILTADLFIHMESLSVLTLPVSKPQLIVELCHRLGATLQKVCTNDCNIDVEECTYYAGNSTDFLAAMSADDIVNEAERKQEAVISADSIDSDLMKPRIPVDDTQIDATNDTESQAENKAAVPIDISDLTDNDTKSQPENKAAVPIDISDLTDNDTESLPENKAEVPIDISDLTDNDTESLPDNKAAVPIDILDLTDNDTVAKKENEVSVHVEVLENEPGNENYTIPTEMPTELVANRDTTSTLNYGETMADFSLRSAVDGVADMSDSLQHTSGVNLLQSSIQMETRVKPEDESKMVKTETSGDNEAAKQQSEAADADVNVGASVKQGGGIDNSVIALIVAGMVVVVAGVTIQKNWKEIKKWFSSRPTAAARAPTETNGTSPEEVPLQDKTMA